MAHMSENLRDEILKLVKRSLELRKASAQNAEEAVELSQRLLTIQQELEKSKLRKAKKTSGRLG